MLDERERLDLVLTKAAELRLRRRLRLLGGVAAVVAMVGIGAVVAEPGPREVAVSATEATDATATTTTGHPGTATTATAATEPEAPASTTAPTTSPSPSTAPPSTVAAAEPSPVCEQVTSETTDGNEPLVLELCVSDTTPTVGQEVVFTVQASDADAPVHELGSCSPSAMYFGDEEATCASTPGCAADPPPPPPEPGEVRQQWVHTYTEAGTYRSTAEALSGSQCPHPYANTASVTIAVTVA